MTNITVSLPDDLARQTQSAGLLRDEAIAALLREAMQKRQVDRLFDTMGQLATLEPALTEAEIDAARAATDQRVARSHDLPDRFLDVRLPRVVVGCQCADLAEQPACLTVPGQRRRR